MTDLNLSEGQEFYIGGQRYVIRDGVPVQEAKRGPLGGELVRSENIPDYAVGFLMIKKRFDEYDSQHDYYDVVGTDDRIQVPKNNFVEINYDLAHGNKPQAKGRVMTAGEAAKLPDIVGKTILIKHSVLDGNGSCRPLITIPESQPKSDIEWHISERIIVEVLD